MITAQQAIKNWHAAPMNRRFYCDGPDHESPIAEKAYRAAYAAAAQEATRTSIKQLVRLFDRSQQDRRKARRHAGIGPHVELFQAGHEVEAASTRGRSHGLNAVLVGFADCVSMVVLHAWLDAVKAWAAAECSEFASPPDLSRRAGQ